MPVLRPDERLDPMVPELGDGEAAVLQRHRHEPDDHALHLAPPRDGLFRSEALPVPLGREQVILGHGLPRRALSLQRGVEVALGAVPLSPAAPIHEAPRLGRTQSGRSVPRSSVTAARWSLVLTLNQTRSLRATTRSAPPASRYSVTAWALTMTS